MRVVRQRSEPDCGVAALATVLGVKPEIVEDILGHKAGDLMANGWPIGVSEIEAVAVLMVSGRRPILLPGKESLTEQLDEKQRAINVDGRLIFTSLQIKELLKGKTGLIVASSLTLEKGRHYVVWDQDRVLDPYPRPPKYTLLSQINPIHSVILLD